MTEEVLIELRNVRKRYGSVTALTLEHFRICVGDVLWVSGENGTGKSTLLRVLAGVTRVRDGEIERTDEFGRLHIAYVPQTGGVYPHLTLAQQLVIWGGLYGCDGVLNQTVISCIQQLGLEPVMDRKIEQLSGGYQKLVALASALSVEPDALLLDEPLSGLDELKAKAILGVIERFVPGRAFVVMTGHNALSLPWLTGTLPLM